MKINGKEIKGKGIAYDGCHKIYILEDENDEKEAYDMGYELYVLDILEKIYNNSCSLRFINNWKLDKCYVAQFKENVKFEK